jgi:AraC-like DNA-binding protein
MTGFLRFSTDALPERDRLAVWSETFGRHVVQMQFAPVGAEPYSQNAVLRTLPGLSLVSASCTGFQATRTRELIADGNDDMVLVINMAGTSQCSQMGQDTALDPDDGILLSSADEASATFPGPSRHVFIGVPRQAVAAIVRFPDDIAGRLLPRTEQLRLLGSYVQVTDEMPLSSPGCAAAFTTHLLDLLTLAINPATGGKEIARSQGVRAARLAAIKIDIGKHLGRSDLSLAQLTQRHQISPRYIQKLFEAEDLTFTEYVLEHRLLEAQRLLNDPQFSELSIGDVASRVGFGDLPYFNRSFRRRFGATPTDIRQQGKRNRSGRE